MKDVILLDGGLGQEIIKRASGDLTTLWSISVMLEQPQVILDVHRDYIRAGADAICINAYTATRQRLGKEGLGEKFEEIQMQACELAQKARSLEGKPDVKISGCLPPIDRSYRPDLARSPEEMIEIYRDIAKVQAPHVDFICCETMSTIAEGKAAAMAAVETGKPVYLSFTVDDKDGTKLRSGEDLGEAVKAVAGVGLGAILINCSLPEAVAQSMPVLAKSGIKFGAYANGFTAISSGFLEDDATVATLSARTDLGPKEYANHVEMWIKAGASIVGGCCEVGPEHIVEIRKRLEK